MAEDNVVVIEKKHRKARIGAGPMYVSEKFMIYVKRKNGTAFFLWLKVMIIYTNKESYNKINVGDILSKKY